MKKILVAALFLTVLATPVFAAGMRYHRHHRHHHHRHYHRYHHHA